MHNDRQSDATATFKVLDAEVTDIDLATYRPVDPERPIAAQRPALAQALLGPIAQSSSQRAVEREAMADQSQAHLASPRLDIDPIEGTWLSGGVL